MDDSRHWDDPLIARITCILLLSLAFGWAAGPIAAADSAAAAPARYPTKPIRLIVAQTAGGNVDFVARSFGQRLSERFGQQIVVDNRPGGAGVIGTELVVHAQPDGYTLLLAPTSHAINPSLVAKLPFDTRRDLAPISLLAYGSNVLVVSSNHPARTVKDIIAQARAQPGKLNFSSSGYASATHLTGELFKYMAGIDMQHVAYKGAPASIVAVASGEADLSLASITSALPLVRSGRLRAIAVTSSRQWPMLPDIPTIAESGVPGFESSSWQALLAPVRTPAAVIERLHREVAAIARLPDLRARLLSEGLETMGTTPQELDRHIAAEIAKWAKVIKAAGLRPN